VSFAPRQRIVADLVGDDTILVIVIVIVDVIV